MKCPNCGRELVWGTEPMAHKLGSYLYCEECGFLTQTASPTKVVEEVESAYKWNRELKDEAV